MAKSSWLNQERITSVENGEKGRESLPAIGDLGNNTIGDKGDIVP